MSLRFIKFRIFWTRIDEAKFCIFPFLEIYFGILYPNLVFSRNIFILLRSTLRNHGKMFLTFKILMQVVSLQCKLLHITCWAIHATLMCIVLPVPVIEGTEYETSKNIIFTVFTSILINFEYFRLIWWKKPSLGSKCRTCNVIIDKKLW